MSGRAGGSGRSGGVRRAAVWILLAAAVAVATAFTVLRATLPSDGGRVAFYAEAWTADGVEISPIDAPASGLLRGDVVRSVGGRTIDDWLGVAADPGAARPPASEPIPYILERNGDQVPTSVGWASPGIAGALLDGWSLVAVSLAFVAVAALVWARRPDEPPALPLALCAAAIAGSSVPWYLGTTVSDVVAGWPFVVLALLTGPLYMLLWPAAVHFAMTFPRPMPLLEHRRWLVPAVYAGGFGAYLAALAAARLASSTTVEWVGAWPAVQLVVVIPCVLMATALFAWNSVRERDALTRTRIRWVVLSGIASGVSGLLAFFLPELVAGVQLAPASLIGLSALPIPLGIAAAILRNHLFDIDVVVNRTLVYGGLTAGVLGVYVASTSVLRMVLGAESAFGTSLLATGLAALVALPLRDALQRAANRLLYGDRDEPWRAMRRLGQRLELAAEPELAFPTITSTVADSLRLPYVALHVVDEGGQDRLVAEHGEARGETADLALNHGGAAVGRLVLGARPGERDFRADERGLLEDLARQAGAAVHAIALRADLARSREQLVLGREEERRRLRRDLHDGLGPTLAAIGLRAEASAETVTTDPGAARRMLDELSHDVRVALADIRRLVEGLRPPALDELGLLGAIEQQAGRLGADGSDSAKGRVAITVDGRPSPLPELAAAVEVAAYRIAVEALTNAVRHAEAARCEIRVDATAGDTLEVDVVDDGRGLASDAAPGVGLESIRARADELGGSVEVAPGPHGGTRVTARLPLQRVRA